MMEVRRMPTIIALLNLYAIRITVTIPPKKRPIHRAGFRIFWPVQCSDASRNSGGHPPISSGAGNEPVTAPRPAGYESPITARNKPIPQALAILSEVGSSLTNHCRIPRRDKAINTQPSTKTAVRARR
jgi:hypothetical protein